MGNKNLVETNQGGIFSKIKTWFKNLFGGSNKNKQINSEIEFEKQGNYDENDIVVGESEKSDKLQYEFSTPTVSKQKIEKIRLDLDNGKIGIESLYTLSMDEMEELGKAYDEQISDSVSKLNEIDIDINNYKRRLSKVQNQN